MAYEEYIDNKRQGNRLDRWFQQILLSCFSDKAASAIYGTVVGIIAFFAKIGIFLMLHPVLHQKLEKTKQHQQPQPRIPRNCEHLPVTWIITDDDLIPTIQHGWNREGCW